MIPLSIGDPSKFGNYDPPQVAIDAVIEAIKGQSCEQIQFFFLTHSVAEGRLDDLRFSGLSKA